MKTPITQDGLNKLKEKFNKLTEERKDLIERKEEAYQQGDPAENTEYIAIMEEFLAVENKMAILENVIFSSEVIDSSTFSIERVKFGLTVVLEGEKDESDIKEFTIVGTNEVDIEKGRISNLSPLGKSLMNKEIDEEVFIGDDSYFIKEIKALRRDTSLLNHNP